MIDGKGQTVDSEIAAVESQLCFIRLELRWPSGVSVNRVFLPLCARYVQYFSGLLSGTIRINSEPVHLCSITLQQVRPSRQSQLSIAPPTCPNLLHSVTCARTFASCALLSRYICRWPTLTAKWPAGPASRSTRMATTFGPRTCSKPRLLSYV